MDKLGITRIVKEDLVNSSMSSDTIFLTNSRFNEFREQTRSICPTSETRQKWYSSENIRGFTKRNYLTLLFVSRVNFANFTWVVYFVSAEKGSWSTQACLSMLLRYAYSAAEQNYVNFHGKHLPCQQAPLVSFRCATHERSQRSFFFAKTKSMHSTHVVSFLDVWSGLRDVQRAGSIEY